jgi:hypothetical protein
MSLNRRVSVALVVLGLVGCASAGGRQGGRGAANARTLPAGPPMASNAWPVRTAEYVDLWLHGFAMVTGDTSHIPLFDRGYRDRMLALRHTRNVYTSLDANQERLSRGFVDNPALVNSEFIVFQFQTFQQLVEVGTLFVQNEGYPPSITDAHLQRLVALLQQNFRSVSDRDWLRVFLQSLQDEQSRFYQAYWTAEQASHAVARQTVDSMWMNTYRAKFARFLRPERLGDGSFILSFPLGGEGRSVTDAQLGNAVAVLFPATPAVAVDAMYAFAHEVVDNVTTLAIAANLTPAERRAGGGAQLYGATADVRAGALLLQRIAPELVQGYMRFYMETAKVTVPAGDVAAAFAVAFPIPDAIRNGIEYQLGLALGGI